MASAALASQPLSRSGPADRVDTCTGAGGWRERIITMVATPDPAHPFLGDPVFDLHVGGKLETVSTVELDGPEALSLAYTPGVARVCEAIAEDPAMTQHYTWVPNTVAVVTDGTAVLGLGDIGPAAAMPVMEGKAVLFKQFGGVDAVPICLATTDVDEIIETVARLAPQLRRDQPGGHLRPALLRDRGPAQGAARHPRLPRRPARHRGGRPGRAEERAAS